MPLEQDHAKLIVREEACHVPFSIVASAKARKVLLRTMGSLDKSIVLVFLPDLQLTQDAAEETAER
jgi:hypothetical protein